MHGYNRQLIKPLKLCLLYFKNHKKSIQTQQFFQNADSTHSAYRDKVLLRKNWIKIQRNHGLLTFLRNKKQYVIKFRILIS